MLFSIPVKELNLETAPVIVQDACRIHLNICAEIEFVIRFPFIIAGLQVDYPNVSSKRYWIKQGGMQDRAIPGFH